MFTMRASMLAQFLPPQLLTMRRKNVAS